MRQRANWPAAIFAGLWLAIIMIPVYVMVRAGFSSREDYGNSGPIGMPNAFTLENFRYTMDSGFGKYLLNSGILTVGTVILVLLMVPPLAYVIVRGRSRWIPTVFKAMLFGLAIPAQVVVIPLYFIIVKVGLYDSLLGVIFPSVAFVIPLTTLILTSTMREINNELYEAMALDGAGSVRTFLTLVLPLSKGGIATIVVFSALQTWNNYLLPLTLTRSEDVRVATLGLGIFKQQFALNVPGLMSAVMLTIVPILLIYIFARRSLERGLMGVGGK
ncbi:carbohydrate ABC transporter permease [Demequina salsinemoris]|uniref:carbohydrate ABC transporter permease n=1 Tax=Demequina salsinemoris TaxID=577470 RepID=UPI000785ADA4|nr:carbohydrate ABC transporter permease [Demequina salsinemoris]